MSMNIALSLFRNSQVKGNVKLHCQNFECIHLLQIVLNQNMNSFFFYKTWLSDYSAAVVF